MDRMDRTRLLFDDAFNDFLNFNTGERRFSNKPFLLGDHKPFSYLSSERDLFNRLNLRNSKAESGSMVTVEKTDDTSPSGPNIIKEETFRKEMSNNVSSSTKLNVTPRSQSSYVVSKQTVHKSISGNMVTQTVSKIEESSTSSQNRSSGDAFSLLSIENPSKRTFSMYSGDKFKDATERLIQHFNAPLYQNFFFLDEPKNSSIKGFRQRPVIKGEEKPIAIQYELDDKEKPKVNLEIPDPIKSESPASVTRSNSKVLKDLVESQQTSRMLWCHMPQVISSGYLEKASTQQRHLQEAKFEVITSEASYYRSILILETHFALRLTNALTKVQHKYIFGHVKKVRKVSESVLKSLSKCFESNVLMSNMCHILYDLVKDNFKIYITYCKNQPLIDKTLEEVRKKPQFEKHLNHLESEPVCQNLKIASFLILPLQRFLRMPLLVEAIIKKLTPDDIDYKTWEKLLKLLKKMAEECNQACGELDDIAKQYIIIRDLAVSLQFAPGIQPLALQSSSRSLLLQNNVTIIQINGSETSDISPGRLTLLSDYLILDKPVGNKHHLVMTYCKKDKACIKVIQNENLKPFIMLRISENHQRKSENWLLGFGNDKESDEIINKWTEALPPNDTYSEIQDEFNGIRDKEDDQGRKSSEKEAVSLIDNETHHQDDNLVEALYAFNPSHNDELRLKEGDRLRIRSKSEDGWCYGERVYDGKVGWFPLNYTSLSSHAENIENSLKRDLV